MSRNVSAKARKAMFASQTGEAFLILLDIDHDDLEQPIRLTSDMVNTAHGEKLMAEFARSTTAIHPDTGATVAVNTPCYTGSGLYVRRASGSRGAETLSVPVTMGAQGTVEASVRYMGEEFLVGGENYVMAEGPLSARIR